MPTEALATAAAAASTPRSPLCPAERSVAATEPATDQACFSGTAKRQHTAKRCIA